MTSTGRSTQTFFYFDDFRKEFVPFWERGLISNS